MQVERRGRRKTVRKSDIEKEIENALPSLANLGVFMDFDWNSTLYLSRKNGVPVLMSSSKDAIILRKEDRSKITEILEIGEIKKIGEITKDKAEIIARIHFPLFYDREEGDYCSIPEKYIPHDDFEVYAGIAIFRRRRTPVFVIEPANADYLILCVPDRRYAPSVREMYRGREIVKELVRSRVKPRDLIDSLRKVGYEDLAKLLEENEILKKCGDDISAIIERTPRELLSEATIHLVPPNDPAIVVRIGNLLVVHPWITAKPPDEIIKRFEGDPKYEIVSVERDVIDVNAMKRKRSFKELRKIVGKNGLVISIPPEGVGKIPSGILESASEMVRINGIRKYFDELEGKIRLLEMRVDMIYNRDMGLGVVFIEERWIQ